MGNARQIINYHHYLAAIGLGLIVGLLFNSLLAAVITMLIIVAISFSNGEIRNAPSAAHTPSSASHRRWPRGRS